MAEGLSDRERYLRRVESLALSTIPVPDGVLAAAPKHHNGVMIALVPDSPEELALDHEEALPADDLHVTLCYLGKVDQFDNTQKSDIIKTAHRICDAAGQTFSTAADGVVVMGQNDKGVPATALLIQAEEIVDLYTAMAGALDYESKYPSFIPHMTAGYGVPVEQAQDLLGKPITFSNVLVKFGDERHTIPLASTIVAAPRGANVIDRVIDSLGRMWDEALHPRGGDGRFIKKNGAVSGKMAVPSADGNGVTQVNANRASVVGFHTFDNDVWVLAEITNKDGSKVQGFAKADQVVAVAPVKARLDALYPVSTGEDFVPSSLERKRQIDLLLAHMHKEYGVNGDEDGAYDFLETIGLREIDLDYMMDGSDGDIPGVKKVDRELSADELDEVADIIDDARQVKELRARVHGFREEAGDFVADDAHVVPEQKLVTAPEPPDSDAETIAAIQSGADPFSLNVPNLLAAMAKTDRFYQPPQTGHTGVSPISWRVDDSDETGFDVRLAGTGQSATGRAYFVKESVLGAEFGNTDIVKEVLSSLIAEQIADAVGSDDDRQIPIPKSVFGDNPIFDGDPGSDDRLIHQPAFVVSSHADYAVPANWEKTTLGDEEAALYNDIKGMDEFGQADATAGYYEDMGEIYGNDIARMVMWDFITLNGDRNFGNAILAAPPDGGEGRVLPIDHGFAFDENPLGEGASNDEVFQWFMNYPLTKSWMNYVRGGIELDTNVTPESIRQTLNDFIDVYGQINAAEITERFRAMPNVSSAQIDTVEKSLAGVVDRVEWMRDNVDMILRQMTQATA